MYKVCGAVKLAGESCDDGAEAIGEYDGLITAASNPDQIFACGLKFAVDGVSGCKLIPRLRMQRNFILCDGFFRFAIRNGHEEAVVIPSCPPEKSHA